MMINIPKYLVLIIALFLYSSCDKDAAEINTASDMDTYLEGEVESQNLPALAVLIYEGESIKYESYLGYSDVENQQALEQDDMFLLASISKMVTGTALLQLYENGDIALDDPINDYLPFDVKVPDQTTAITFRMLLTHTSGINDGTNAGIFYSDGKDSDLSLGEYMEKYLKEAGELYDAEDNFYDYEPGTGYNYSNMATALIGHLVTEISGIDFNDYCSANIFQPLEMDKTYWSLTAALQSNNTIVKPYEYVSGDFEALEHYTFPDYPNGSLRATPRDMMHFSSALAQEGTFAGFQMLKEATVNEMLSLQIPNLDATQGLITFALEDLDNVWGHDGGEKGVSTILGFNPSNDIGVIVLTNLEDADVSSIFMEAYKFALKQ